ncbi:MAG: hypothetical protein NTW65_09525 [Deltaproteobacteria bacterium]|nr:hypothetical protein [Deltaproteobacteria bacterium]
MKNNSGLKSIIFVLIFGLTIIGCSDYKSPDSTVKYSGRHGHFVCGCGGSCVSTAEDGIPDTWKTIGVDSDCDGKVDLDLASLGADPRHKDVFIQVDSMAPRPDQSAVFTFPQLAMNTLVDSFNNAPVSNPDGTKGIHLHIITGNVVPYSKVVTLFSEHNATNCSGPDSQYLANLKSQSMDAARTMAFHYALIADLNTCDSQLSCNACDFTKHEPKYKSSGFAIMHGKDFIVSLGNLWDRGSYKGDTATNAVYNRNIAGVFMHELGHNFGLRHGGGDEDAPNYKPNYLSIMNYRYQLNGIPSTTGPRIDYSREALRTLDETQLDEIAGLGSSDPTLQFTFMDSSCIYQKANASGPVDWDGSGTIDSYPAIADLNPEDDPTRSCGDVTDLVMIGHEDWSTLDYGFYNQQIPPDI